MMEKSRATAEGPEHSRNEAAQLNIKNSASLGGLEQYLKSGSFLSPPIVTGAEGGGPFQTFQERRPAADEQLPANLLKSDGQLAASLDNVNELEQIVKRQKEEIKSMKIELLQKREEVDAIAKITVRKDGLTYEDLLKVNEYLKKQNQKLQVRAIEVRDVEDLDQVGMLGYGDGPKEEVFNPYKTDFSKPDYAKDMPTEQEALKPRKRLKDYDAFQVDQIIQENFDLKQQLIRAGCHLREDGNHQTAALSYQLKQRDQLIKQLRDQLHHCEASFRDEVERITANQREQHEQMAKLIRQYGRNQTADGGFGEGGSLAAQNFEKELKIAISKL